MIYSRIAGTAGLFIVACSKPDPPPLPTVAPAAPVAPTPTSKSLTDRLAETTDLAAAIRLLRYDFRNTDGDLDTGSALLSVWGANFMTWPSLQSLPQTKFGLAMKDIEGSVGRRLCISGVLIEIQVDRSAGKPIGRGGIADYGDNVVRFEAVQSTGELVANSAARFCGVVTGLVHYANSRGGTTHAVHAVGMFDLPENRPPIPQQAPRATPRTVGREESPPADEVTPTNRPEWLREDYAGN